MSEILELQNRVARLEARLARLEEWMEVEAGAYHEPRED